VALDRGPVELRVEGADPDRPVVWVLGVGALPAGLQLDGDRIVGTPTELGTSAFSLVAFDSSGDSAQRFYGVSITDGSSATAGDGGCVCVRGADRWPSLGLVVLMGGAALLLRRRSAR
jgi:hypothetical protein